jgi:nucleotide-binding universal stress UspA family protein
VALLLIATDLSPASRRAFDAGLGLAEDLKADIVLLHVFPKRAMGGAPPGSVPDVESELERAAALELSAWADEARKHGCDVETVARSDGKAADAIVAQAKARKATLIVVGTHGRTGLRHVVLGSVAEGVLRQARIPVLVVPSRGA